jgi:hypothetical protein
MTDRWWVSYGAGVISFESATSGLFRVTVHDRAGDLRHDRLLTGAELQTLVAMYIGGDETGGRRTARPEPLPDRTSAAPLPRFLQRLVRR